MSIRKTAEAFQAKYGMPVVPLKDGFPVRKGITGKRGDLETITDEDWERATQYGVMPVGHTAVDFDSEHAYQEWIDRNGDVGPAGTLTVKSPRGYHLYFKGEMLDKDLVNASESIDVRSGDSHGYMVGPGSPGHKEVHEGRSYELLEDVKPQVIPDEWKRRLLISREKSKIERTRLLHNDEPIPQGQRHAILTALAGKWHRNNKWDEQMILYVLIAENQRRCEVPLERHELETIAASVGSYEDEGAITYLDRIHMDELVEAFAEREYMRKLEAMSAEELEEFLKIEDMARAEKRRLEAQERGRDLFEKAKKPKWNDSAIISADELYQLPPPSWLIEGVWPEGSLAMMYGEPGTKKSFLALDWALHMALGLDWHGQPVKKRRVLYLIGEGKSGYGARLRAWHMRNHDRYSWSDLRDNFICTDIPLKLSQEHQAESFRNWLANIGEGIFPELIVVDTLRRFTGGMEENSAQEVGRFIDAIKTLTTIGSEREVGYDQTTDTMVYGPDTTVLVLHHANRTGQSFRGSSALEGDFDTIMEVSGRGGMQQTLKPVKFKDAEQYDQWMVTYERHGDSLASVSATQEVTPAVPARPASDGDHLHMVATWVDQISRQEARAPSFTTLRDFIRTQTELSVSAAGLLIDAAVEEGLITQETRPGRGTHGMTRLFYVNA